MRHHKSLPDGTILVRMDEDEFAEAKRRARKRVPALVTAPAQPTRPAEVRRRGGRLPGVRKSGTPADLVRAIARLAREGFVAAEIGPQLGIPKRRVIRIADRRKIELASGAGFRRVSFPVRQADIPALDAVAAGAGVTRVEIVRRMVAVMLESGGKPARTLLGPLARTRSPRKPRKTPEERSAALQAEKVEREARRAEKLARVDRERLEAETRRAESAARFAARPEWLKEAVAAGQHPLRAVRLHLGLRQRDVAERARFGAYGENDIGDLERSGRPLTAKMAARLAAAMGVKPEWLSGG